MAATAISNRLAAGISSISVDAPTIKNCVLSGTAGATRQVVFWLFLCNKSAGRSQGTAGRGGGDTVACGIGLGVSSLVEREK